MNEKWGGYDRKCPICNASKTQLIHKGTRDRKDIDVFLCKNCGCKYLSDFSSGDYEKGYMNGKKHMSKDEIKTRLERTCEDDNRRYDMLMNMCKGKSVLDFGCGFGGFLRRIKNIAKSEEVLGVELGCDERGYLASIGIQAVKSIDYVQEKYDIVTLFHVFEHLNEPVVWLKKIREYVNENGRVYIEVPNADDILLSLYESNDFANFTYWSAHLYLYTTTSFEIVVKESGVFEISDKKMIQRYPLANHMFWLAKGEPGGQNTWSMLSSDELNKAYNKVLERLNACDTLFFELKPV